MDYKKVTYYSVLKIFLMANLFCFFTQQFAIYDSYLSRYYYDPNWGWSIFAITFITILLFVFSWLLEMILNKDEQTSKIIILGNLTPLILWFDMENQFLAVFTGVISFITVSYWYFFTFYWKKKQKSQS